MPQLFAVTIDCPVPAELARFYQAFLGGTTHASNDDFVALVIGGEVRLDFQRVANPEPAPWPDPAAALRLHLDFAVDDVPEAERQVLALGATLADFQPGGERFRVFLDPVGHPFCLAPPTAVVLSS
ncbi:VOC family protein [Actinomadura barringtoniae]|uniref:VOC family protein n=1 Tax=Actinomadura barringtoniae TaxID=1427535 RepID=A0A939T5X2_9ACTN|nr:VOC family protein [Actinomadura barringtoniae]MBO2451148.1 VOC family protein [Actinomadura barringtoniae]